MKSALRYVSDLHPIEAGFEVWELARSRSQVVVWETAAGAVIIRPTDEFGDVMRRQRRLRWRLRRLATTRKTTFARRRH